MEDFLHDTAVNALLIIERDAMRMWYNRKDASPELEPEDACRKAIQTAIYKTTELFEPSIISEEESWLSDAYWDHVSS